MNETEATINPAVLGERLKNLMRVVQEIKDNMATRDEIAHLVTQAEHSAVINSIEHRLERLEGSTPAKMFDMAVRLCVALSAVAAAGGWVYHLIKAMP